MAFKYTTKTQVGRELLLRRILCGKETVYVEDYVEEIED
jgi:hypothetical protein